MAGVLRAKQMTASSPSAVEQSETEPAPGRVPPVLDE